MEAGLRPEVEWGRASGPTRRWAERDAALASWAKVGWTGIGLWRGRGERLGQTGLSAGLGCGGKGMEEKGWAASGFGGLTGLGLFSRFFSFSFSFLFQHTQTNLNSNLNLNPTLTFKQIKQCTSMNAQTS